MTTPSTPPAATPPKAGWFEDPQDPRQLRYFDGIVWTAHTTPLVSPTAADSSIGRAQPVPPQAEPSHSEFSPPPLGSASPPDGHQRRDESVTRPGLAGSASLPDGALLAAWWQRALAWVVDNILVSIIGAVLALPWTLEAGGIMREFFDATVQAATTGGTPPTSDAMMTRLLPVMLPISLISAVVSVLWEVLFLRLRGATPGRRLLGIGVRPVAAPGQLSWIDALKRQVLGVISVGFSLVAALATFGSILSVMDPAWMLLDPKRQTLSDKVAGTVVVRTR